MHMSYVAPNAAFFLKFTYYFDTMLFVILFGNNVNPYKSGISAMEGCKNYIRTSENYNITIKNLKFCFIFPEFIQYGRNRSFRSNLWR